MKTLEERPEREDITTEIDERDGDIDNDGHAPDADDDDDDLAEEDAWLRLESAIEDEQCESSDVYKPQLMDIHEMRSLRRALHTSEARLESDGHLREFVPRKPPATALLMARHWRGAGRTTPRVLGLERLRPSTTSALAEVVDPFEPLGTTHRTDYSQALRHEMQQVRELHALYEDTKRLLLNQLDVICSTKPADRTGGQEAHDKLAELLAFAANCSS